ncbi:16S rRNA (cytosine(1402)-N(4))-methyltransferase [Tardibacter chloracetimidivorans]|uniref:Ribosomal RNA small subunit methyltransferase H n=1 Tax=Tardibacter chloracetimidivorans TaxID=1921510 RepID=A0A1L3ZUJ2_9SPHN|nr:16S rRNA (cytosine(1402)-N(4))-methyltransferase RsmH [Tardibacter chloracetimidivorans]API59301.1 16S rRNA (cytosine(1402)-N(4))-methyltransferase [Tardibacter chloracetimidivorans]
MTAAVPAAAPHVPVLLAEVMRGLALNAGDVLVDGTFGAGGYTRAALAAGAGHVWAFDRDPNAIAEGRSLEDGSDGRLTLIHDRFSNMVSALGARGVAEVDAVTFDIGVSSMQLDRAERGFSFQSDGPLDMRMEGEGPSAADFLNTADESMIADVIFALGEEPKARRIARAIVHARPIERTGQLADIVRKATGHRPGEPKDPATRTFQAIRIHVNRELEELDEGLRAAERMLKPGGRLAVVSFHSLEDRVVKRFLRDRSGKAPGASRHMPLTGSGPQPSFEAVAKPVRAGEAELKTNPRARSATLRVARRTAANSWEAR